jgi:hypothetical protein
LDKWRLREDLTTRLYDVGVHVATLLGQRAIDPLARDSRAPDASPAAPLSTTLETTKPPIRVAKVAVRSSGGVA